MPPVKRTIRLEREQDMKKILLATLASGLWIIASEFLRNEVLLKQYWLNKYAELAQPFPSAPINNALWALWAFLLASNITFFVRKLTFTGALLASWTLAFLMMWVVIWNLNVLPQGLLCTAAPWSIGEVAVAILITKKIMR